MTRRRPLVLGASNIVGQLPVGDTFPVCPRSGAVAAIGDADDYPGEIFVATDEQKTYWSDGTDWFVVGSNGGGGGVVSVVAGDGIAVDDTDPSNPIVSASGGSGRESWLDFTLQLNSWTAGSPSYFYDKNLFTLPANKAIVGAWQRATVLWERGGANGNPLYCTLGIVGTEGKFFGTTYDLPSGSDVLDVGGVEVSATRLPESTSGATQIVARLSGLSYDPFVWVTGGTLLLTVKLMDLN